MTRSSDPRCRRLLLAAAVSGICAAALAAPATADDGADAPIDLTPATIVLPAMDAAESAAVEAAVEAAEEAAAGLDLTEPEDVVEEPVGESGSGDTVPTPVEPPIEDGATGDGAPDQVPQGGAVLPFDAGSPTDTTPDSGDTAVGSTETAEDEVSATPVQAPTGAETVPQPTASSTTTPAPRPPPAPAMNVNVSVRVGSAGDNGAVTQANTASTNVAPSTPQATSPPPTASSSPSSVPTRESTSSQAGPTWYWEWDCLSAPAMTPIPTGSTDGSVPSSWTWIWNCGDNSEQYRAETPDQYQQINANISIRISSPGDNGPVTQTNVTAAIAATLPSTVASTVELHAPSPLSSTTPSISIPALPAVELPLPTLATDALPSFVFGPSRSGVVLPGISFGPLPTTSTAPRFVVPSISLGDFEVDGDGLGATDLGLEIGAVVEVVVGSVLPAPVEPVAPAVAEAPPAARHAEAPPPRRADAVQPRVATPVTTTATSAVPTQRVAVAPAVAAQPEATRVERPAPSWKRNDSAPRSRAPVPSPSSTSASAAGAGGSSGGGLPVFLALPFLVALLDLARRVALERVTWPSGHRRRMPDTPG